MTDGGTNEPAAGGPPSAGDPIHGPRYADAPAAPDADATAHRPGDDVFVPLARPVVLDARTDSPRVHDDVLLSNVTAGRAWVELVLGLLLLLVWIVVAESALYVMTLPWRSEGAAPSDDLRTLFIPTVGLRTLGVVGVLALLLRGPGGGFRTVGLARSGWGLDALIGVGATAVAYALMIILMTVMWLVWPGSFEQLMENGERLTGMIPKLHPLLFLPVAICIGVYEELLFRGFLMTRLRRGTGSWTVAVLVSTGAFTALHAIDQTPLALVAIASLSLVASVVTIRRRSITPAIVTHALFDYTQFLSLYLQAGETWT